MICLAIKEKIRKKTLKIWVFSLFLCTALFLKEINTARPLIPLKIQIISCMSVSFALVRNLYDVVVQCTLTPISKNCLTQEK